jgi:hypothetical protein
VDLSTDLSADLSGEALAKPEVNNEGRNFNAGGNFNEGRLSLILTYVRTEVLYIMIIF